MTGPTTLLESRENIQNIGRELLRWAVGNQRLGYLKSRWLDEREYEDFNEYKVEIKKELESAGRGYVVGKIGKSFSIEVTVPAGFRYKLSYGAGRVDVKFMGRV